MQVGTHADGHAAAQLERAVRGAVRRFAVRHVHCNRIFRLHGERPGLCAEPGDLLLRADKHRHVAFQLFRLFELFHRKQDRGHARAVIQALAAILAARELHRLLRKYDRRADLDAALCVRQSGVDRHLVDGNRLVLLACFEQMRRQAGYHAVQRLVRENGDLAREQHARVNPADRRKAHKAAVQHLGDDKTDLVEMCVQQDGLCVLSAAFFIGEHIAVPVGFDRVAVWAKQFCHGLRCLFFKPADRRQCAQRPQGFCKLQG